MDKLSVLSLGSVPIWSTREQMNEEMADTFEITHHFTLCILDLI